MENDMTQTVRIERLGAQGDGIAEGGAPFVAHTLPGETVGVISHGDRARLEAVLEPSAERIAAVCPHVRTCGGCGLQHASDGFLARWKAGLVTAALSARGIEGVAIRPVETSPPGARLRIAVAARRGKKGVQIGFHAAGSSEIVPIESCAVAAPALVAALPVLSELVMMGASRKGELRMTLTLSEGGIDVAVTEAKDLDGPRMALLAGVANRADLARLSWNGEIAVTRRTPVQRVGAMAVVPPPGGFLQATAEGQAALTHAVREIVGPAARVADLFAGSGTFALALADRAEVLAVESDAGALKALHTAWRANPGLHRVTCERRDLFNRPLRGMEMKALGAVVLDPPRAGARAQAEQLAEGGPARIASVSCNPATFARDARILIDGGYRLDWVLPVDQFRWSPHLELVGSFSR
jgi:23S rRNA (uracil1939-C5)-methyltransferase